MTDSKVKYFLNGIIVSCTVSIVVAIFGCGYILSDISDFQNVIHGDMKEFQFYSSDSWSVMLSKQTMEFRVRRQYPSPPVGGPPGNPGSDGIPGVNGNPGSDGPPGSDAQYCPCPSRTTNLGVIGYKNEEQNPENRNQQEYAVDTSFGFSKKKILRMKKMIKKLHKQFTSAIA
ncbi:hypothetical protein L5515_014416 [Caenorhabditis briggsae]|uniref:Nematode cuticle collagen N-terminal domain-containing protein n=1 Tax=Caenorhabditis briggsae TaxID=6238 RepID=A0AAE9J8L7_CAEBR|nr:hypothetical protein L5515_014416 [Caenorhabditis briggsae]